MSPGFTLPLTLNLYGVGPQNAVGPLIATSTVNAFIPWRPEPNQPACGDSRWQASDGNCYNGATSIVTFDFAGVVLPQEIIYGLAYNTEHHGYSPTGVPGPYNSLNFGLATTDPTVGDLPASGTAYWNTSYGGFYTDGGAGGVGVFRQDQGWAPFNGAIEFATPEPVSFLLAGAGLLALASGRRSGRARSI